MPPVPNERTNGVSVRRRVILLSSQAFALGLLVAWITIPANAIFLDVYGSGVLPFTYVGAAGVGVTVTIGLSRALRRRAMTAVAAQLLSLLSTLLVGAWVLLARLEVEWVSIALVVLLPVTVPVGFVFIVGQAGMLLDVRTMKALYPRVIAGFALGFALGGIAGSPMLSLLGRAEHLLLVAAAVALVFLGLVVLTARSFPNELAAPEEPAHDVDPVTLRTLLSNRFVVLILAFQMLSAVESQWLDFLVYDRAGQRYDNTGDLARFVGRFAAIAYGADILFLALASGVLLRKFGLRYGLTANPAVVLALVVSTVTATAVSGSGATVVFVLIVATRVSDLVLSDGSTRASVGAAYQAVPLRERLAAQANVESLAVPIAIGLSGVVLVIIRATVGTDGLLLPVLTSLVLVAWIICALIAYRHYGANLLINLRQRAIQPADLSAGGQESYPIVERLLSSSTSSDVRLALTVLEEMKHADLADHLDRIAGEHRDDLHAYVLERLSLVAPERAVIAVGVGLAHPRPAIRAAALSAFAHLGERSNASQVIGLLHDPSKEVRVAAARVVADRDSRDERQAVIGLIRELTESSSAEDRSLGAQMLAGLRPLDRFDAASLDRLLDDDDPAVVQHALGSVVVPAHVDTVIALLARRATATAALEALVRGGEGSLASIDASFLRCPSVVARGDTVRVLELCARACRNIGSRGAAEVLARWATHQNRHVGLSVVAALAPMESLPTADRRHHISRSLLDGELTRAARILRASLALGNVERAAPVITALTEEFNVVRQRVLAALSLRYGPEAISRASFQLAQRDPRIQAVAFEWFDVTLSGSDRLTMGILDPDLSVEQRLRSIGRYVEGLLVPPQEWLREMAEDIDGSWAQPWLSACAVAAASSSFPELRLDLDHWSSRTGGEIVLETEHGLRAR